MRWEQEFAALKLKKNLEKSIKGLDWWEIDWDISGFGFGPNLGVLAPLKQLLAHRKDKSPRLAWEGSWEKLVRAAAQSLGCSWMWGVDPEFGGCSCIWGVVPEFGLLFLHCTYHVQNIHGQEEPTWESSRAQVPLQHLIHRAGDRTGNIQCSGKSQKPQTRGSHRSQKPQTQGLIPKTLNTGISQIPETSNPLGFHRSHKSQTHRNRFSYRSQKPQTHWDWFHTSHKSQTHWDFTDLKNHKHLETDFTHPKKLKPTGTDFRHPKNHKPTLNWFSYR